VIQPTTESDGSYFYSAEAAAIFGIDQDALNLGGDDHYASLLHPDDRQEAMQEYRQFFASPDTLLTQDYRIRRPDGSIRHLRVVSQKLASADGGITEVAGTIQDLTEIRRAELAVRQVQLILTAAQKLAGVGYWFWEQAGGATADDDGPDPRFHYSAEAQAVSGISEQLMQTLSTEEFCRRFVHEADRTRALEVFTRFASGTSDQYTLEYGFHHPYRGDRILRAVALRERNAAGQPLHAIGMIQDITDLRRDEAALRDQQHQLAAAHRLARLGYWSCTGGNDGTPIRHAIWSREAATITGIDSETAQAALLADDFEHRFTHPDDRLRVMKAYGDLRAQRITQYDIDYRLRQPGGGEIWLRSLASLRQDGAGRAIGLFGILQDVSDRKRAEAELRLANQSLANAQRIAHVGSWSRDIASGHVVWSDETFRIFGHEPRSLEPSLDLLMAAVHQDDRAKLKAAIETSLLKQTDYVIEHRIVRPDGSIRHVREQGEVSLDSDGQVLRLEGVILDITEIKARELALNEARLRAETADRAKTEFLGNMSHELRTPLNAVIGFADVLSQQLFGPIPAAYRDSIAAISQSGRHLLDIITDLLEMSRIESGERRLAEHPFDPLPAIADCCRMVQSQAEAGGVRLVIDDTGQLPVLLAEERAFKQVLGNLLSNAIKFTPQGGTVAVTVAAGLEAGMLVVVSDTGRGIEPSVLPQLGKPFAQGESTLTRRHGGIGLGLAISRRLMEMHGGRLDISSRPGEGTRVTMQFPKERLSLP
jgi:PAS domain S-box-containing protein